jgi:hypothetical protein
VTNHSRSGQSFAFQFGKSFVNIFLVAATNDNVSSIDGQTLGHGEPNSVLKTTMKSISKKFANQSRKFNTDPSVDAVTTATRPCKDLLWRASSEAVAICLTSCPALAAEERRKRRDKSEVVFSILKMFS